VRKTVKTATVDVQLDGKPYFYWVGPQALIHLGKSPISVMPLENIPALAARDSTTFHSVRLRLITGSGSLVTVGWNNKKT